MAFPYLGRIARNAARSKHDEEMPTADAEVRGKIAAKAKDRIDHETSAQITAAAQRLHDEVLGPMDSLLLDPMLVAAETTDKRCSMRIRLAGPDQLGGNTPRPQAPADSLASMQIHESVLNNVLERLELDGQTFDLAGLGKRIAERMHRFQPKPIDPDQEDVKITFAAKDALRVRCNDGRMEITLAIARLSKGSRKWKDFQVRAYYRPVVHGRSVDLARDGIVQLIGPKLNVGSQIALRGVFLKVFSQKEAIHATPESFVNNPKLDGLAVTQLVIDDGWIGAAIGPQRIRLAAQNGRGTTMTDSALRSREFPQSNRRRRELRLSMRGSSSVRPLMAAKISRCRRRVVGEHVELHLRLRARRTHGHVIAASLQVENHQITGGAAQGRRIAARHGYRVAEIVPHKDHLHAANFQRWIRSEIGHQRLHGIHALLTRHLHADLALAVASKADK